MRREIKSKCCNAEVEEEEQFESDGCGGMERVSWYNCLKCERVCKIEAQDLPIS